MESSSVVIDIGSAWCKAGLALENYPTLAVPSVVGYQSIEEELKIYSVEILKACPPKIRKVIGLENMRELKEMPNQFVIDRGCVLNWDAMEDIWYYIFDCLGVKTKNHPVIITEYLKNDKNYRQKTLEVMMETFDVPSLLIGNRAELSLFGSGLLTGIVLDCGADLTHIAPVLRGQMIPDCTLIHEVGGIDLSIYIYDSVFCDTMTRHCLTKRQAMDDLKEKLCFVSKFPGEEKSSSDLTSDQRRMHVLPDGNIVFLSEKFVTCPNLLFDPSEFGLPGIKLSFEVLKSAMACNNKTKAYTFSNVVLSGGSTLFPGFSERLSWELNDMKPLMYSTEVVSWPNRMYLPWVGGAILSRLSTFTPRCITRQEYYEAQSAIHA